jgi:hypothetical protein
MIDEFKTELIHIRDRIDFILSHSDSNDSMTSKEACRYLGISPATLSKLVKSNPMIKSGNLGHRNYVRSEVVRLKNSRIKKTY